jgi:hypothetical protein
MTKKDTRRGRTRFQFVKAMKELPDGIMTVVYNAIKAKKAGTVAEISQVAVNKFGLLEVTGQDPMVQTAVMLGRLRAMKAVKKVEAE